MDLMILKLENMLDTEKLTRELIDVHEDDGSLTTSQVEWARKILDDASD